MEQSGKMDHKRRHRFLNIHREIRDICVSEKDGLEAVFRVRHCNK